MAGASSDRSSPTPDLKEYCCGPTGRRVTGFPVAGDERARQFRRLAGTHDRMERLIDGLLALARCGRSRPPTWSTLGGGDAWERVDAGGAGGADTEADLVVTTGVAVEADADRLRRLFEALFENAVAHGGASVVRVGGFVTDGTTAF